MRDVPCSTRGAEGGRWSGEQGQWRKQGGSGLVSVLPRCGTLTPELGGWGGRSCSLREPLCLEFDELELQCSRGSLWFTACSSHCPPQPPFSPVVCSTQGSSRHPSSRGVWPGLRPSQGAGPSLLPRSNRAGLASRGQDKRTRRLGSCVGGFVT